MWDKIWRFIIENHIYQAVVTLAVIHLVFFPGKARKLFGKFRKIKAGPGGIEFEGRDQNIDPNTPCPYTMSRDITFSALRGIGEKVGGIEKQMNEIMAIVKNMSIDQQKQLFYDKNQPEAERLAGGLKYLYQGGNGNTKPDVIAFANGHKDIYNALTYVMPDLRLAYEKQ